MIGVVITAVSWKPLGTAASADDADLLAISGGLPYVKRCPTRRFADSVPHRVPTHVHRVPDLPAKGFGVRDPT